jgi:hypothetical protein
MQLGNYVYRGWSVDDIAGSGTSDQTCNILIWMYEVTSQDVVQGFVSWQTMACTYKQDGQAHRN